MLCWSVSPTPHAGTIKPWRTLHSMRSVDADVKINRASMSTQFVDAQHLPVWCWCREEIAGESFVAAIFHSGLMRESRYLGLTACYGTLG